VGVPVTGEDFYLGAHHPGWLWREDVAVPLFVSARRLRAVKRPRRAVAPWALDSGGFTELSLYGRWQTPARQYAEEAQRWHSEVGSLRFAAPCDWMCEPVMLQRTGLSVPEHQRRTVANYLELRSLAPTVPWVPVLQGWAWADYLRHADDYAAAGVDLSACPTVGLGSVCRRQDTTMAEELIAHLAGRGLRLHGFGFKLLGLRRCARHLASADSMAWSFAARRSPPLPGCTHRSCANCPRYALTWRRRVTERVDRVAGAMTQTSLFGGE
jgi:hypothetical protein